MTLTKHYNALTIPHQALKTTNLHVINPIFNFWKFTYIFYFTTHIDVRPVLEQKNILLNNTNFPLKKRINKYTSPWTASGIHVTHEKNKTSNFKVIKHRIIYFIFPYLSLKKSFFEMTSNAYKKYQNRCKFAEKIGLHQ